MSCTPSSHSSLSTSDESKFVPRSSIMNENSFLPNHFGGSHDVPKTDHDAAAANSCRPASASCTLNNRTACTAKDDFSARISRVVASLSRGMPSANSAESGLCRSSHRDRERENDDESGIVGATIVFTPEPSPSSSPKTNGSKKSHEDDPLDGLPTSASAPIPNPPLPHRSLAGSNATGNTRGSSNVSSHYIGTIPIHSMEDETQVNEKNEENKDEEEDGGNNDSNSVDLKKCDGSITTEYDMLDGNSTRASSRNVTIEDLEDDKEEAGQKINQKAENETKQKVEQETDELRNDDANKDSATEEKPPEPSSLFSSPTTAEINALLHDMEHNNDGSSIPSTLPSLHSHGFESPATATSSAPFKTPKQHSDEQQRHHHPKCSTPRDYLTRSVVVQDSPNGHRSDVSSLHSSSVGEFSAMTRSMIRRIRKSIKGEDDDEDSPLGSGKEGTAEAEERIPSFQDLMNLWEWKTSFGEIAYGMTGRTLFREDKSAEVEPSLLHEQGSSHATGAASGKELEDAEMKPSALFSDVVAAPGQPSSDLGDKKDSEVTRDNKPASSSPQDSANRDRHTKVSGGDPPKQTSVRKSIIDGSDLTVRELVGELLRLGVYFMMLLSLLAFEIASPVIQAVKKRSFECFGKSRESTDAGVEKSGHIDEDVSHSNEPFKPFNETMAESEVKIAVSSNAKHAESHAQEANLSSRSNPFESIEQISADNAKTSDTSNDLVVQRVTSNDVHAMNRAIGKWLVTLAGLFLGLVILTSPIPSNEPMEHRPHPRAETTPRTSYCLFSDTGSLSILQGFEFFFLSTREYNANDSSSRKVAQESSQDKLIQGTLDERAQKFSQNNQEPSQDPIDESTNGHIDETAKALSEESCEKPCEECISERTDTLMEEPLQVPGRKTIDGEPIKETGFASTHKPLQEAFNERTQKQTEESVDDPFVGTDEIPITDVPMEELTEARLEKPVQEILQAFSLESSEASTVGPIQDSFEEEAVKVTDEFIQDLFREPFKEINETIEDHSEYHSTPPNFVGVSFNETASHILDTHSIVVFHPEDGANDKYYSAFRFPGVIFTAVVSISIIIFRYFVASVKTNAKEHSSSLEPTTFNKGMWTNKENSQFFQGVKEHGTNWKKVAECIPTRTAHQVISKGRYWVKIGSPPEMKRSKRDASSHSEASDTTPKIRNKMILGSIDVDDVNLGEGLSKLITPRSHTKTKSQSMT